MLKSKAKSSSASDEAGYNISVEGSNVKINTKPASVSNFYSTQNIGTKTASIVEFTSEQNELRALDCMKDGMVGTRVNDKVIPNSYPNMVGLPFSKLAELETVFEAHRTFNLNIKKYAWTKVSKDSELTPKLQIRVISQESGLHPQYYVAYNSLLMNFANEVLDPAGRETAKQYDVILFDKDKFVIDDSFFTLFGMPGVSLTGTRKGQGKYDYTFTIKSLDERAAIIIKSDFTDFYESNNARGSKTKVQWFAGNVVKNSTIDRLSRDLNKTLHYQIDGKWGSCTHRDIIRALFMLKTAGDALQVLLLFVFWQISTSNQNSAITTCDKVVYLLCMILGLKCFLTSADKLSGKKLRCIEYYDPVERTIEHAKRDFASESEKIKAHNKKIIEVFKYLSEHPATEVSVSGDNKRRVFKKQFYDKIVDELTKINADLDTAATNIESRATTPEQIDSKLNNFKEHFTINPFIRKQGENIIFGLAKKFTKAHHVEFQGTRSSSNGFGSKSIFEHGIADSLTGGGSTPSKASRRSPHSRRGREQQVFKYIEFDDSEFEFIDDDDGVLANNGLLANLLQEIQTEGNNVLGGTLGNLTPNKIKQIIDITIKSELLYNFYLQNQVLYGQELRGLIQYIVINDIDLGYFFQTVAASAAMLTPPRRPAYTQFTSPTDVTHPLTGRPQLSIITDADYYDSQSETEYPALAASQTDSLYDSQTKRPSGASHYPSPILKRGEEHAAKKKGQLPGFLGLGLEYGGAKRKSKRKRVNTKHQNRTRKQ